MLKKVKSLFFMHFLARNMPKAKCPVCGMKIEIEDDVEDEDIIIISSSLNDARRKQGSCKVVREEGFQN